MRIRLRKTSASELPSDIDAKPHGECWDPFCERTRQQLEDVLSELRREGMHAVFCNVERLGSGIRMSVEIRKTGR